MRPAAPRPGPAALLQALADQLAELGVRVLDARACSRVGVLVTRNRVVWCYGPLLRWRQDGQEMTWPAADAYGAARRLAEPAQHANPEG
jgi:hypothetical protein